MWNLDIASDVGKWRRDIAHLTAVQFNPQRRTRIVLGMYCYSPRLHSKRPFYIKPPINQYNSALQHTAWKVNTRRNNNTSYLLRLSSSWSSWSIWDEFSPGTIASDTSYFVLGRSEATLFTNTPWVYLVISSLVRFFYFRSLRFLSPVYCQAQADWSWRWKAQYMSDESSTRDSMLVMLPT